MVAFHLKALDGGEHDREAASLAPLQHGDEMSTEVSQHDVQRQIVGLVARLSESSKIPRRATRENSATPPRTERPEERNPAVIPAGFEPTTCGLGSRDRRSRPTGQDRSRPDYSIQNRKAQYRDSEFDRTPAVTTGPDNNDNTAYHLVISRSYSACDPTQYQTILSASRMPSAR